MLLSFISYLSRLPTIACVLLSLAQWLRIARHCCVLHIAPHNTRSQHVQGLDETLYMVHNTLIPARRVAQQQ